MKTINSLLLASALAFGAAACGDDDGPPPTPDAPAQPDAAGMIDGGTPDGGGIPPKPTPGARIDRMGRPAINTALNHPFEADPAVKGMAKDDYNHAAVADWANFIPEFMGNQAIFDGLDTVCGNALAADFMGNPRYATIATVLTDDQLYVNTEGATCGAYLGVEANATGIVPNSDCGGRAPAYDVIDTSYSVLATSGLDTVDDNIDANDVAFLPDFPYLAAPH